jgi:hypothetical protein
MVERRDRLWSLAACWTGREAQHHFLVSSSNISSLISFVLYSAIAISLTAFASNAQLLGCEAVLGSA